MEASFDLGMIGIGVMGSNLLLNMADHGFAVIGYDLIQERVDRLERAATPGTIVKGTTDIANFIQRLKRPRKLLILVPAGAAVDLVLADLLPLLEKGDLVIDAGNSYHLDTQRRVETLQSRGIHFFGMGTSGGEVGARFGPSLMPGGDREAYQQLRPVLEAIAAKADGRPCVAYMGNGAAGHYVKMVHNGIEYAMMQIISEAYDILKRGAGFSNEALHQVFDQWNKGSLQSFLMEVTAAIFTKKEVSAGGESSGFLIDAILDKAGSKGTGKWTTQEALNIGIPCPTIDMAVAIRDLSGYKEQRAQASQLYQPAVSKLSLEPKELAAALEDAVYFAFVIAYIQGLNLLARASAVYDMQIPLPDIVAVWKGGCIIRSTMLRLFEHAYAQDPLLSNLLLDESIAKHLHQKEAFARRITSLAISAKIPVAAISSSMAYFDAFCSERLPVNLIQAQRDFFGAHTYQRIDKEGSFHTEWQTDPIRRE